ncbi:MAG TPA: DUF4376 domain-containing protein [Allosphingosinicella sp.]|jgi:hypothetical protein
MLRPSYLIPGIDGAPDTLWIPVEGDALPDGAVALPEGYWDAHDLEVARANKRHLINAKKVAVEEAGADTPFGRMDSDPDSQRKVTGAFSIAFMATTLGQPFSESWTMADNSVVVLNGEDMVTAALAVKQHVSTAHAIARALKDQLEAAATLAEIEAVDVDGAPWP